MQNIKISPSILACDFSNLGDEVTRLCKAGADYIHIDVMDGNLVPNITMGPVIIEHIKKISTIPLDVHLIINNVELLAEQFIKAGADILTFHVEATESAENLVNYIRKISDVKIGVAISPATTVESVKNIIDKVDLVLIMTVSPGFCGQKFIQSQVNKIQIIAKIARDCGKKIDIAVDGGIIPTTARLCINAGANILISGSYIFSAKDKDYQENIKKLRASV